MQTYMRESCRKKTAEKDSDNWRDEHAQWWKGTRDKNKEREQGKAGDGRRVVLARRPVAVG